MESLCEDDGPSTADMVRLVLIVGMGTTVCLLGILLNTMLLLSFSRLQFRNSNLLYLFLLAVFDIFVELCFMAKSPMRSKAFAVWKTHEDKTDVSLNGRNIINKLLNS
ncbi:hypothetical protein Q1695_006186 [Nippostrongylus brasiliensis]|nr:hypothetical protein Q1695_006186 [Nippostrongylus brasiliensis]